MITKVDNPTKKLASTRYESFLNTYQDDDGIVFYNLLRSINIISANDSSAEDDYQVMPKDTWYYIAYKYYDNINLWWLVCEYNQIKDPTKLPIPGTKLKLLRPEYVNAIIEELNRQIHT
jgi:hypothetical protein